MTRALARIGVALLLLAVLAAGLAAWALRRSLPPARESLAVRGLEGPVTILYDSLGVPTIRGATVNDLAFGQGYAHARDRRFQMELIRRNAAGRLAELFGPVALAADREARTLGFGALADSLPPRLDPARRARFEAYAAGVNAWDATHPAPPEFLALGIPREPWRAEDFALVLASMFRDLQFEGENDRMVAAMDAALPRPLVDFLLPDATPMDVTPGGGAPPAAPATPGPHVLDLRVRRATREAAAGVLERRPDVMRGEPARGSNHWAIAPARTRRGRAILSGDPHLNLRVPVIWHRQRLEGPGFAVTGITLPGAPDVIMGSNGRVAWSFTNVEGDFLDFVRVRPADPESLTYAGPTGPEPFRVRREVIRVKGASPETLAVRETRWGPVLGVAPGGAGLLAIQWVGLDPTSYDFDLLEPDRARDLGELVRAFDGFRGPAQNVAAADDAGRIGWRIVGRIPRRAGFDPLRPREGADPNAGWFGYLPQDSMPRALDPTEGFLVTANQRTVGGEAWRHVGSGAAMPWRARRIHDVLASRADWDAEASAALQNDLDDALLAPAAGALDRALTPAALAEDPGRARYRGLLDAWDHRADTTSAPHAFLRYLRVALHERLLDPLLAPCLAIDSSFAYTWPLEDEVVRRLLDERPAHLLDPRFAGYEQLALAAADSAAARLARRVPGVPLERVTWGRLNRARIRHPLGAAMPALGRWLNMPEAALAGGSSIVRVARPTSGASMRLVAEPGGETRFALPGGQSGHFLSRNYGDAFADWVAGRYVPLDPGRAVGEVRLRPR